MEAGFNTISNHTASNSTSNMTFATQVVRNPKRLSSVGSDSLSLTNLPEMDFLGTLSNLDLQEDGVDVATNQSGESDLGKSICSALV